MEITTSFVFLRADVDKCLRLVLLLLLLPSTMTCSPLLLKNDDDGCATDVLKRPCMRRDAVAMRSPWLAVSKSGERKKIRGFPRVL